MKIFSGSSNKPLAEDIALHAEVSLSPVEIFLFPDGERRVRLEESVLDEDVVIVQSTSTPVDHNYMELFFLVDSAKRSGAKSVTVVMPYFGYQRQDHVFRDGEAVSLDVVITMLEALKVDKIISFDLHSIKIPELFHIPITHLSALPLFGYVVKKSWTKEDTFLVSPDKGGLRRIEEMGEILDDMSYVIIDKQRDVHTGEITMKHSIDTSLLKKRALIVDDMISSGKTIAKSAEVLVENGVEEIFVFATHAVFSQEAPEILQNAPVIKVFVTDSVLVPEENRFEKLETISLASDIAKALQ